MAGGALEGLQGMEDDRQEGGFGMDGLDRAMIGWVCKMRRWVEAVRSGWIPRKVRLAAGWDKLPRF